MILVSQILGDISVRFSLQWLLVGDGHGPGYKGHWFVKFNLSKYCTHSILYGIY